MLFFIKSSDIIKKEFPIDLAPSPAVAALVIHNWGLGILILHANEIYIAWISWKNLLKESLKIIFKKNLLKKSHKKSLKKISKKNLSKEYLKRISQKNLSKESLNKISQKNLSKESLQKISNKNLSKESRQYLLKSWEHCDLRKTS